MDIDFSSKLLKLRLKRHLTVSQVATALFVSDKTLESWENGTAIPNEEQLNALRNFYGIESVDAPLPETPFEQASEKGLGVSEEKNPVFHANPQPPQTKSPEEIAWQRKAKTYQTITIVIFFFGYMFQPLIPFFLVPEESRMMVAILFWGVGIVILSMGMAACMFIGKKKIILMGILVALTISLVGGILMCFAPGKYPGTTKTNVK